MAATFLLKDKSKSKSSILIYISFRGQYYKKSTGESTPVVYWNQEKARCKVVRDFRQGNDVNSVLDRWEVSAMKTIAHFKEWKMPPSKTQFWEYFDSIHYTNQEDNTPILFTDYFERFIENNRVIRSPNTIKGYITCLNKLKEYQKGKGRRLDFGMIGMDLYNDLRRWFLRLGYSDNYFGMIAKTIKTVCREAVNDGISCEGFRHKDFTAIQNDVYNVYLSESELTKIYKLDLTAEAVGRFFDIPSSEKAERKQKSLNLARDIFLVGAYTGLRISDLSRLEAANVDGDLIRITTQKTGVDVVIPLHPIVREILSKGCSLRMSDQHANMRVKELARMAGITDEVLVTKIIGGRKEQHPIPKCDLVTTHTARRSFATNAYKSSVPPIAIMKITGHKKESTFLKYIKVSAEENAEMLLNHPFFK